MSTPGRGRWTVHLNMGLPGPFVMGRIIAWCVGYVGVHREVPVCVPTVKGPPGALHLVLRILLPHPALDREPDAHNLLIIPTNIGKRCEVPTSPLICLLRYLCASRVSVMDGALGSEDGNPIKKNHHYLVTLLLSKPPTPDFREGRVFLTYSFLNYTICTVMEVVEVAGSTNLDDKNPQAGSLPVQSSVSWSVFPLRAEV